MHSKLAIIWSSQCCLIIGGYALSSYFCDPYLFNKFGVLVVVVSLVTTFIHFKFELLSSEHIDIEISRREKNLAEYPLSSEELDSRLLSNRNAIESELQSKSTVYIANALLMGAIGEVIHGFGSYIVIVQSQCH